MREIGFGIYLQFMSEGRSIGCALPMLAQIKKGDG